MHSNHQQNILCCTLEGGEGRERREEGQGERGEVRGEKKESGGMRGKGREEEEKGGEGRGGKSWETCIALSSYVVRYLSCI